MSISNLPVEEAIPHPGLRMVVVGHMPSPRDRIYAGHLELPLFL